jgi:hypothetical protein
MFKVGDLVDLVRNDGKLFDTFQLSEENLTAESIKYFSGDDELFMPDKNFYCSDYEPKDRD